MPNKLKAGIFGWFGFALPMEERARLIKAAGFHGVMLWWGDEFAESFGPREKHPDIFRRAGLEVLNAHLPYYGIDSLWTDGLNGDAMTALLLQAIESCKNCGIDVAVLHLEDGQASPPGKVGLDRVKRLADAAERASITLAVENLRSLPHLDYVFENVTSPRLGFCFDSGHAFCHDQSTDLLKKYNRTPSAIHLHDNDGTDDMHRLPFGGKINWPKVMGGLSALGYSGPIALEVDASFYDADLKLNPEEYLTEAYARAKKLYQLI